MKKLELKHLAPYLPYGLVMRYTKDGRPFRGTKKNEVLTIQNIELLMFSQFRLPILRPLSDLTKEIEIDGKRFVPIEKICKTVYQQNKVLFSINNLIEGVTGIYYYQVEKLFEWHFDIFGLIEKNLAIDINTLK